MASCSGLIRDHIRVRLPASVEVVLRACSSFVSAALHQAARRKPVQSAETISATESVNHGPGSAAHAGRPATRWHQQPVSMIRARPRGGKPTFFEGRISAVQSELRPRSDVAVVFNRHLSASARRSSSCDGNAVAPTLLWPASLRTPHPNAPETAELSRCSRRLQLAQTPLTQILGLERIHFQDGSPCA